MTCHGEAELSVCTIRFYSDVGVVPAAARSASGYRLYDVEAIARSDSLAVQDPDFRASVRRMTEYQAAERDAGDQTGLDHGLSDYVRERVAAALTAGIDPPATQPHRLVRNRRLDWD